MRLTVRTWLHCLTAGLAWLPLLSSAMDSTAPPAGFTSAGDPYLGSPTAPVVVEEWSDFLCPFCARHFSQTAPQLIERYVSTGLVRMVFRDFPIAALHPTAVRGHLAARCAGEQGAARYWAMHGALFSRQKDWSRMADPESFLAGLARDLGLDQQQFAACTASERPQQRIDANAAEGTKLGFNGTPSFRLATADGKLETTLDGAQPFERFDGIIQSLLAGKLPPQLQEARPELPGWARPEGWQPDPLRPGYNVSGDAYRGNLQAPLTVITFTDYQCVGCARHELDVQPTLDREFVDTGKVLWIVKALPLKEHQQAALASAAAECAGDQGKFWQMHRALFSTATRWSNARAETELAEIARETGLNAAAFKACLSTRVPLERVLNDLYDAQDVVRTTPSFVLVSRGEGSLMGPLPADQFSKILRRELELPAKPAQGEVMPSP